MGPTYATNAMSAEYAQMTDALRWQQQRIIELETENRELRRQLADLRSGVGISLIIEGRQIPLASPGASSTPAASWASGAYSPSSPAATAPTSTPVPSPSPLAPPQRAYPTYPPIQPTAHAAPPPAPPSQRPNGPHSEAAFAENAWLTGSMPAAKSTPPDRQQQPQPARPMPRQGNRRAEPQQPPQQSQRFTPPAWLSEEAPTVASWETEFEAAAPAHSRTPAQRQRVPQTPIGPVPEEIWRAEQRYESGKFPTLAQITGQHHAVRIPGKRKKASNTHDDRSPYTDSFVLG